MAPVITHGFPIRSASLRALLLLGGGWQPLGDSRRLCLREHQRCFSFKAPLLFPLIGSAPSYINTPTQLRTTPNENRQKHAQQKTPHTPTTNTNHPSPRPPTTVYTTLPARYARKNTTQNNPSPRCTGGRNTTSQNLPPLPPCTTHHAAPPAPRRNTNPWPSPWPKPGTPNAAQDHTNKKQQKTRQQNAQLQKNTKPRVL